MSQQEFLEYQQLFPLYNGKCAVGLYKTSKIHSALLNFIDIKVHTDLWEH